jgi:hypothetical protein
MLGKVHNFRHSLTCNVICRLSTTTSVLGATIICARINHGYALSLLELKRIPTVASFPLPSSCDTDATNLSAPRESGAYTHIKSPVLASSWGLQSPCVEGLHQIL